MVNSHFSGALSLILPHLPHPVIPGDIVLVLAAVNHLHDVNPCPQTGPVLVLEAASSPSLGSQDYTSWIFYRKLLLNSHIMRLGFSICCRLKKESSMNLIEFITPAAG